MTGRGQIRRGSHQRRNLDYAIQLLGPSLRNLLLPAYLPGLHGVDHAALYRSRNQYDDEP